MNKLFIITMASFSLLSSGCSKKVGADSSQQYVSQAPDMAIMERKPNINTPSRILLKTTVFKMNGDYGDKVAVTLNADGSFAYYPAPSDITTVSAPVNLGNGWWLNRQGLGPRSTFLKYTFEEYAALPSTPTIEQLKEAIIPNSRVTDFESIDIPASEAMSRLTEIKQIISSDFSY